MLNIKGNAVLDLQPGHHQLPRDCSLHSEVYQHLYLRASSNSYYFDLISIFIMKNFFAAALALASSISATVSNYQV